MSECGVLCVFSIVLVGFVWGATNPFLRAASKRQQDKEKKEEEERLLGIVFNFLKSFRDWRFSAPFALNQTASILFNVLVVNLPVTVVVPCVNAIQFISTVFVGRLMGERMEETTSPTRQTFGMILSTVAIIGMLCVD